jgi:hypothetical protein
MLTGTSEFFAPLEKILPKAGDPLAYRWLGGACDREIAVVTPLEAERDVDVQGEWRPRILVHGTVS